MDGNHGLTLECQSVTVVSALQGTKTSSKLFKVEHRVPPRVRKSRNRATCQSKNRISFGLSVTVRCWTYPSRKASPHHDGNNRYVAYSFCKKKKKNTVYHARCGSTAPCYLGPRRGFRISLWRSAGIQKFYTGNGRRARRKSVALDNWIEATFLVDTSSYFTSNSLRLLKKLIPPLLLFHLCDTISSSKEQVLDLFCIT